MKKTFLMMLVAVLMTACSSKTNPVDEVVAVIDGVTAQIEKASSMQDLSGLQSGEEQQTLDNIKAENSDYELTEADKEKLISAIDKMMTASFNKGIELSGQTIDETSKQAAIDQANAYIKAQITAATTLGEALADR